MSQTNHTHPVVDSDARFVVDAVTRKITSKTGNAKFLMQGDHNSERFTFEIPRYIEGHDMSKCNVVQVCYINVDPKKKLSITGIYTANDLKIDPQAEDTVVYSWLISKNATQYAGTLGFVLRLICEVDDEVEYLWGTEPYNDILVAASIDPSGAITGESLDLIKQWEDSLMDDIRNYVDRALREYIDATRISRNTANINKLSGDVKILNARLDACIMNSDSTLTSDAELHDIRAGSDGVTYPTAGEAIRTQFANADDKLFDRYIDCAYPVVKWSNFNGTSDTSYWGMDHIFAPGYIDSIVFNSVNGGTGDVVICKWDGNGVITTTDFYAFSYVAGMNTIPIKAFVPYEFVIFHRINGLVFGNVSDSTVRSGVISATGTLSPNYEETYLFAFGINRPGVAKDLATTKQTISQLYNPANAISNNNNGKIKFDFVNLKFSISDIYIARRKPTGSDIYSMQNHTLDIRSLPSEGYYVIYALYDFIDDNIVMGYSNGETLKNFIIDTTRYAIIAGGLTNGRYYFSPMDINRAYLEVVMKDELNTDDGTEANDNIIPKFAEKTILTESVRNNKWFGKTVNFLGDSVTKGENSADSYMRMQDDNIASIAKEKFGFSVARNYGVGGSRISSNGSSGFIDRYSAMGDADLVVVWGGTNDFGSDVEMGDLNNLSDNTKFKPAFYNLLVNLTKKYSGKQIIVLTPMHRNDIMPDNVANGAGHILKDYRDAEIEICELLGIRYYDMWTKLGFTPFNSDMRATYMPDGLHPSVLGMRKYVGPRVCEAIDSTYPSC